MEPHERRICTSPVQRVGPRPRRGPAAGESPTGVVLLSDGALYAAFADAWLMGEATVRIPLGAIDNVEWRDPRRLGVQFRVQGGDKGFLVVDILRTRLAEGRLHDELRAQLARFHEEREAEGFWQW